MCIPLHLFWPSSAAFSRESFNRGRHLLPVEIRAHSVDLVESFSARHEKIGKVQHFDLLIAP